MKDILFILALMTSLFVSVYISNSSEISHAKQMRPIVLNPLKKQFDIFANKNNLDLKYADKLQVGSSYKPQDIEMLNETADKFDIIVFGDSSVYMGLSGRVIFQLTHKNVGYFSFPALSISQELIAFIDLTKQEKLKKGGLLIFMFNDGFWSKNYYQEQEDKALDAIINNSNVYRQNSLCMFCKIGQISYNQEFKSTINSYFNFFKGTLSTYPFYELFLISKISPTHQAKKLKALKKKLRRSNFLIEKNFVLILKKKANIIKKKAKLSNLNPLINNNILLSKQDLKARNINFAFVIPLSTDENIRINLHRIYNEYFFDQVKIEMNSLMPNNWVVDAQNRTHMANLGSLQQSIMLATWINRYFENKNSNTLNLPID